MPLRRSIVLGTILLCCCCPPVRAAVAESETLDRLVEQNRQLIEQIKAQQKQIDDLKSRLDRLDETAPSAAAPAPASTSDRQVRISGELSFAFFRSGSEGFAPNSEFRVDDARLFLEAPIWKNVYVFGGLDILTRDAEGDEAYIGEFYLDAENVFESPSATLSFRAGRMNIPFGEEYQHRNALADPLVTHSLADFWGIDEGLQIYGRLGRVRYNLAVQNGSGAIMRDYTSDKSWTLRLGFDPTPQLSLSASAMRSGRIDALNEGYTELWFGNAFFRALGLPATTKSFAVELAEFDAAYRWRTGHVSGFWGRAHFDDDSTAADNSRHLTFYSVELQQQLASPLYAALRYSAIEAPRGYPIAGLANSGKYFYNPYAALTRDLHRLSLGLGYRFGEPLLWKFEYTFEDGRFLNGGKRENEDLVSSVLAIRF